MLRHVNAKDLKERVMVCRFSRACRRNNQFVRSIFISLETSEGATLKLQKCNFCTKKIDYRGHVIHLGRSDIASPTMDATNRLMAPRIFIKLNFFSAIVASSDGFYKNRAAMAFSWLRYSCGEATQLDERNFVSEVENTKNTHGEISHVHVWGECDVENEPITGEPDEDRIKMEEKSVCVVEPKMCQMTKERHQP